MSITSTARAPGPRPGRTQTDSDAPPMPAGLVAGYALDEATGSFSVSDVTSRSPGTLAQGCGHTTGVNGSAADMPADAPGRITVPSTPELQGLGAEITLAAWINVEGTSHTQGLITKTNQFGLIYGMDPAKSAGSLLFSFSGTNSTPEQIPLRTWTHVAATAKAGIVRYYVNGQPSGQGTYAKASFGGSAFPLMIGCATSNGTNCNPFALQGSIDDVGIWSRALSQAEIQTVMNQPQRPMDRLGDACDACPGNADRTCAPTTCLDSDGDGYGQAGATACAARQPAAFDCDDANPAVHPNAVEVCDGLDNNCDGRMDESCVSNSQRTVYNYNAFNQLLASGPAVTCVAGDRDCDGKLDVVDNCPANYNPMVFPPPNRVADRAVAYYKFDGNANDSIGTFNGAKGTFDPPFVFASARSPVDGKALVVTATAGAVTIPSTLSAALSQTALSAEAWVYLDAGSTGLRPIVEESFGVDGNRGFSLMVDETGRLAAGTFLFASGGWFRTAETAVFPTNQWTHVAATYDGTRFRIYRNGTKVAESGVMSRPPNLDPWLISTNGGNRWRGMIDDVAVYAYALSEAQVQTHAREQDASDAACDLCPNDPSASCVPTVCVDADQDGYGAQGSTACAGGVDKIDCDDGNAAVHPGAPDVADGVDNDCDGVADGKMVASGVMRYDWDANGNQVRKVGGGIDQRYVFDARDRMIEVKSGGSSIATYGYDTKNLRVEIADSAGERRIVLDGIHELMELEAGTTSRVARYDYDPSHTDALLAQLGQVGGSKAFAVSDALGSVYGLTDTLSVVQAKYGYDVYGARGATLESITTPWGVTGRRMDDTGFAYYRDRYFSPAVGRFLAADSMGDVNGPNLYSYVLGNPTAFRDPSGHFLEFFDDLNFSYRWLFCWGDCIDSNRADALVDKALLAVPAFSAYPKSMIPPFDTRKVSGGSPLTTILSSLSHYTGIKSFRTIGRFASRFATPVTILEGFFDWGVILGCGVRCAEECQ